MPQTSFLFPLWVICAQEGHEDKLSEEVYAHIFLPGR